MADIWNELHLGYSRPGHMDAVINSSDIGAFTSNPSLISTKSQGALSLFHLSSSYQGDVNTTQLSGLISGKWHKVGFGLGFSSPIDKGTFFDSLETQSKNDAFASRQRLLSFLPALSYTFQDFPLNIGLSFPVYFGTESRGDLNLNASSSSRVQASVKPKAFFKLGFSGDFFEKYSWAISYSSKKKVNNEFYFTSQIPLGLGTQLVIVGSGVSNFFYDAEKIIAQLSARFHQNFQAGITIDYARWSQMPAPFMRIAFTTPSLPAQVYNVVGKDVFSAAIGVAWSIERDLSMSAAYRFQPRFVESLATQSFDSFDQHILSLAIQYQWLEDLKSALSLRYQLSGEAKDYKHLFASLFLGFDF